MNKYCFEMYEYGTKGQIFLGYKTVQAKDAEQAHELAVQKLADNIKLFQIYLPQD